MGIRGQRILDLGAGTGALAVPFARQGARVTALDLSAGQLEAAREAARKAKVKLAFKIAPAENTRLPGHSFDAISASMCWLYFDPKKVKREVLRLLTAQGRLMISSLIWVETSGIPRETLKLVAAYNSQARGQRRTTEQEIIPEWSIGSFRLQTYHEFIEEISFTRESWRGRIRASKWIGATLPPEQTAAFDCEHEALLRRIAPPSFKIPHRIRLQVFTPK